MNDTLKVLQTRRSIRSFKSDAIPEDILSQIVSAGTYAPTGMGMQSPSIIVISNKIVRDRLSKENARIMKNESIDPFYGAPVILLVICKNTPTALYDGAAVITNMLNAAWSLGIGSCWIHRAKEEIESSYGKELLSSLGIEGDYIGIDHIALGYIKGDIPQPKPRKKDWVYYIK